MTTVVMLKRHRRTDAGNPILGKRFLVECAQLFCPVFDFDAVRGEA